MNNRKKNRLKEYDYSKDNLYFVTTCVKDRLCCFGSIVGTGRDLSVQSENSDLSVQSKNSDLSVQSENSDLSVQSENSDLSEQFKNHDFSLQSENRSIDSENEMSAMKLNQYGLIIQERISWLSEQYAYVVIHNSVIMPNHVHLIVEIDRCRVKDNEIKIKSLSSLMGAFKTTSSKLIHESGFVDFYWHRSFHDSIIRNGHAYQNVSNYIDSNPQNWSKDSLYDESK